MLNRTNKIPVFILAGVLILIFAMGLFAREDPAQISKTQPYLAKPTQDRVFRSLSNVGNWAHWIDYDGRSGHTPSDNSGGFYPRGTAAVIFTDGLVWGGYVRDGNTQNPRMGGVTYNVGTTPGWIVTPGTSGAGTAVAIDPGDARVMVYRIRRDWEELTLDDVKRDASELNEIDIEDVTDVQAQQVLDDYQFAWENWPGDVGAPYYDLNDNDQWDAGVDEPGIADADQVLWFAVNDLVQSATIGLYGSDPMGIEQQTTFWSYNQPGATLGQLIFKKFKFINKSGVRIDSMYVGQWSDPDVGTYTDDLAGCDTSRSLGYSYSGFVTDGTFSDFGLPPATVGYDFFQGPIVASPGDTAIFDLQKLPDFKNLPMTSFGWFASGSAISDPDLGDYDGTLQWYNLIRGFIPDVNIATPQPYTVGNLGVTPTKFPLSGDPFRGTGDIDASQGNFPPGDRRIAMCSGPFVMEPGDVQEVVVAVVGGIVAEVGGNNVNAVEQMKLNDDFAQFVYDNLFQALPKAPAAPKVKVTELENQVVLDFGSDQTGVEATEASDPILGFDFEGYNIYQKPTATATKEQSVLIATFDRVNQVRTIRGAKFIAAFGDIVEVPLQKGTDNGIQRYFVLEQDYLNDLPLYNGNTYYFAVTAFNYNSDPTVPEPTLESGLDAIVVVPQGVKPGSRYPNKPQDHLAITSNSTSTGSAEVLVVDPSVLTGNDYTISFEDNPQPSIDAAGDTIGNWYPWRLTNTTSGAVLLSDQRNLSGDQDYLVTEGLLAKAIGPTLPGLAGWDYDGNRWVSGVNWGGAEFFGGLDIGANFFGSELTLGDLVPIRMEWQDQASVDANGYASKGAVYRRDLGYAYNGTGDLPVTVYDVKDPANPRRVNICFVEDDREGAAGAVANNIWDMGWNGTDFGANGAREYLFFMKSDYDEGAQYDGTNDGTAADVLYAIWPQQRGTRGYLLAEFTMDVFANLPNTPTDSYDFSTEAAVVNDAATAKADVKNVNVFPNPYYAFNPSEADRFEHFVTFNHLPANATIRIFNLAGVQVRKIERTGASSQFEQWDLTNERDIPVASGMYIAFVDMPDQGEEKVLKLMIVQPQENLRFY